MQNLGAQIDGRGQPFRRDGEVASLKLDDYPKVSTVVQILLALYVGAFFLQAGYRIDFLRTIRFEFLIAGLILALAIPRIAKQSYPPTGVAPYVTLLMIAFAIQIPFSVAGEFSYHVFVDRVLKFAAMGLVVATFCVNPRVLKVFIAALLLSCFKMGEEGLVGNLTGSMVWQNQGVMRLHGSTPMYMHPNSFAGMALGTLPFIYYLYPVQNKYGKAFLIVLLIFAINIIVFSGSRTAYVGFLGFLGFLLWRSRHRLRFLVAVLLVAIVAINYIPNQYVDRFESIITGEEKEGRSADARLEILEDSVAIFIEHPFGVGISAFPAARAAKFGRSQDTHNLYFEVATNLGIQGLIIFLLLIAKMALLLKKTEMKFTVQLEKLDKKVEPGSLIMNSSVVEHRNELRFLKATTSATLAYLVIRLVLGLFGHDLYEIYWWVVLGLAVAISRCNFVATKRTHQICLSAVH